MRNGPKKDIHKDKLLVILGAPRSVRTATKIASDLNGEKKLFSLSIESKIKFHVRKHWFG